MEYEEENATEDDSLFNRIKESPRTVSALIIILIVAAAIYAFSGDSNDLQNELALETDTPAVTEEQDDDEEDAIALASPASDTTEEVGEETMDESSPSTPAPAAVSPESLQEQTGQLPEARKTESAYVEVAQQGDGVTHLARRATTRYMSEHSELSLSNEHRIFIEDYIKDRIGTQQLNLGEEVSVSFDLVAEATTAAQQLSSDQLQNLNQYTGVF